MPTNSVVHEEEHSSLCRKSNTESREFDFKYYSVTDTNKFMINNVSNLVNDDIILNVDIRTNTFEGDSHSVWKLVREGDADYRPGHK